MELAPLLYIPFCAGFEDSKLRARFICIYSRRFIKVKRLEKLQF
jgi:hypothetical protein